LDGVQPAAKDGEPLPGLTGLVPKVFAALALNTQIQKMKMKTIFFIG
jgi:hypothetical protein